MYKPIKATPTLTGKEAIKFLNKIHTEEYIPSYPVSTPKLTNMIKLIEQFKDNK